MPNIDGRATHDLASDPSETADVADEHPTVVSDLTRKMTEVVVNGRTTAGASVGNDTDYWPDLRWMTPGQYRNN